MPVTNSIFSPLSNPKVHRQVLALAIPMVLSNITVPLLGLVDAAVIGHLDHAWYLGGVALGSTMISVTFWLLGFLRMSTTGLAAQSYGGEDRKQLALVFVQGSLMALLFALVFLIAHNPIADLIFGWSDASAEVKHYGMQYFSIRVWSAPPAALMNFVLLGWLLGTQNSKAPMWMVIITNVTNIALDLLFVIGLGGWKVEGAALASVIADYSGMGFGLMCVWKTWRERQLPSPQKLLTSTQHGLGRFVKLNRDIFLRSLCLQAAFSFMTFQGASFGDEVVAANAVLMSFLMIISYGMDGFAYAMEAMVGKAIGAKDRQQLSASLVGTFFWSLVICLGLTALFGLAGSQLIASLQLRRYKSKQRCIYWLVVMPLASMWCFLLDGIFVGATKGKDMRNSMFVATSSFFVVFYLFAEWENHALWFAMTSFMLMRGIGLGVIFLYQWHKDTFLAQC
ncbi:LOW QUALITY PROTEIN: DNA-damage-inducible protein [Vibrio sp. JCM 18904]|nr:LOW QUALITY PROTEIN: DNA-damage-inducible protein [Vibrio sp. JCM 18904]